MAKPLQTFTGANGWHSPEVPDQPQPAGHSSVSGRSWPAMKTENCLKRKWAWSVSPMSLERAFFNGNAAEIARELIGASLFVDEIGGLIVETEAYDATDPASHSFVGRTARNAAMFGPPGHAYVYRSYGMHWCLNFVCLPGSAVLVRALEPLQGLTIMQERRGIADPAKLCSGPGRLCKALGITRAHDGLPLDQTPFRLEAASAEPPIIVGPRIGISKGMDTPWRFGAAHSPFLSRRF